MLHLASLTPSCVQRGTAARFQEEGKWRKPYLSKELHCHYQNDSCIKMVNDESHFNAPWIVRDKVTETASTEHIFWWERRAEAESNHGPAYQPNVLPLGQAGSQLLTCCNLDIKWGGEVAMTDEPYPLCSKRTPHSPAPPSSFSPVNLQCWLLWCSYSPRAQTPRHKLQALVYDILPPTHGPTYTVYM